MAAPVLLVEFTTDDPDDTTPSWTDVTEHVRAFTTSRGRDSELSLVEAGTASITLSNRGRDFDPTNDATLRPMNRWRISVVMDGPVTEEVFTGYAESYDQQWPATGKDAVTVVSCVDEFKVLALDNLPTMDPPRDTYKDLIEFDKPHAYWQFGPVGASDFRIMAPTIGQGHFVNQFGSYAGEDSPIIGDYSEPWTASGAISYANARETTGGFPLVDLNPYLDTGTLGLGDADPGNMVGLSSFTVELWFKSSEAAPGADRVIALAPRTDGGASWGWGFIHMTTGKASFRAHNTTGSPTFQADSNSALSANTWYHLVGVVSGSATTLYVNGVAQTDTDSYSGSVDTMDAGAYTLLGGTTAPGGTRYYDEFAIYRTALSAARILAHYEAGALRAFPIQDPGARVTAVLDAAGNVAPRDIDAGSRQMTPTYQRGQAPLEALREAEAAENVDAVLFIARDGTITFLADGHRSSSPYNTVQATFDDDGTDLPYQGIDVDYSESFLFNEWTVTRRDATTTTETDGTSVTAFYKRSRSLTDLPITTEADQDAIATALLAKYKDPQFRVTSLELLATEAVAEAVFPLDIGHRIRVFRTQPGGGRIDQTLFIQKIDTTGEPGRPIQVRLSVSPL